MVAYAGMRPFTRLFFCACIIALLLNIPVYGQFYNGHQMTFGKNRVQYNYFYWSFYRFDRFDTYFNEEGKELAQYTEKTANRELDRIEGFFDYHLDKRLIFLVYNKLTDYRQSNIGLISGNDEYNTGGVTKIVNNKVFLYFDGDHRNFEKQISAAITEVLINEMLYGVLLKENMTNSTLINLPVWFKSGLISYVAESWNLDVENKVKDGILGGKYKKFNRLEGNDAIIAGHSFWKFIADTYGESVIPNIVYLTRINKNPNAGFLYVLGFSLKELSGQWIDYYKAKYSQSSEKQDITSAEKIIKYPRKNEECYQVRINPAGKYLAYATNEDGQYKIWTYNTETGKRRRIFKREHKLDQIPDYSFPLLAWNPSGRILAFFTEEKGGIKLYYYNLATRELDVRNFLYFEKITSFSFSNDGLKLVFSGVQKGRTDIFVYNIGSATNEQITNDLADDFSPRFIENDTKIVFSSDRASDTLGSFNADEVRSQTSDLFVYNYTNPSNVLVNLTSTPFLNNIQPVELRHNEFAYLADDNGIMNRYLARFDSTISFIDTAMHYRYFTRSFPITNFDRNIEEQDLNTKYEKSADVIFNKGRYNIYDNPLSFSSLANQTRPTQFRKQLTSRLMKADSLNHIKKEIIDINRINDYPSIAATLDTSIFSSNLIDINHYVFEEEKLNYYNTILSKQNIEIRSDTSSLVKEPKIRIYLTSFYTNFVVSQVDFSFLNASYQAYTGGAVYYNPGFNVLFKLGTNDLFEDYKVIGGVRFAGDFDSNEYLLSFENLKKRTDKQVIFHRQVFKNNLYLPSSYYSSFIKTYTHELMYVLRYPFSQIASVKGTVSFRNDRTVFLAIDDQSLHEPDIIKAWLGLKGEYIFDDTRYLGINLFSGTRYKFFVEYYQQVNKARSDLWVVGVDFRHYTRIHRNLIWASRFAASSSFGKSPLIYYLGSLDNWINWSSTKYPTFDYSVPVDPDKNYAYQTLATNMRGFTQNIRNGSNFALINNELRFPAIRYLVNKPISNNFLNNFQVIGFFDVGSAWTGLTPYSGENAYDNEIINYGDLKITIDSNRDPIVAGYGFGLRSQLLGYFVRLDWAWGIENKVILPRIFYFSLNLDF
jgi:hypothetical protein